MPSFDTPQEKKNLRAMFVGGALILLVGGIFIFRTYWNNARKESPTESPVDKKDPSKDIPTISAEVIRQKILNGDRIAFLDVRDQENFDAEHIPHSLLTSPGALSAYSPDPNTIVVIVFSNRDAQRKEAVSNILKQKSYPAFLLKGGIEEWKQGGNQLLSQGDPNSFLDQSKVTYISPAEAKTALTDKNSNLYLLDVQSEQDYQKKHLKGAVNIPLDQLEKRSGEIPPGRNIIVYGETDLISFQGGVRLNDLNIYTAKTLTGNDHLKPESGFPLEP